VVNKDEYYISRYAYTYMLHRNARSKQFLIKLLFFVNLKKDKVLKNKRS